MLKDRKFDQAAVDDLVHLKQVMALSNEDVAEALRERCVRIEKKYGNLMLNPEGASQAYCCACCTLCICWGRCSRMLSSHWTFLLGMHMELGMYCNLHQGAEKSPD